MLYLPPDPKPGQPIQARDIEAILRYLRSITPRSSAACDVVIGSGGATFKPRFPTGPAGLLSNPAPTWPFKVYDASTGSTPQISVVPGAINSLTPTLGGNPINLQIGSPPAWPTLEVGTGTTYCWFEVTYSSSNVATSVLINTGGSIPASANGSIVASTGGTDYYGLSTLIATVTGGKASVQCLNDFVSGNLYYSQCVPNSYWNSV
jgi:hypothetical protein